MEKQLTVLSLFDGMSAGRIALERAGFKIKKYLASEVDKHAIKVAIHNYPDTIQIGDVTKVSYKDGVLYTENGNYEIGEVDLVIGGSPCQGFSFAGKQLNFDDPRSALFFEFIRIKEECSPKYFMLENVKMKKEYQDVITHFMGVPPIVINSALVSAQNRVRLYWTNIPEVTQPDNRKIYVSDILENSEEFIGCMVGRRLKNGIRADYDLSIPIKQIFELNLAKKSNCLTTVKKDNLVFIGAFEKGRRLDNGKILSRNFREGYRIYSIDGKAATLTAQPKGGPGGYTGLYGEEFENAVYYRQLTAIEAERLQTLDDNYTAEVSDTQRFRMIGNGWNVDTVSHIFSFMKF